MYIFSGHHVSVGWPRLLQLALQCPVLGRPPVSGNLHTAVGHRGNTAGSARTCLSTHREQAPSNVRVECSALTSQHKQYLKLYRLPAFGGGGGGGGGEGQKLRRQQSGSFSRDMPPNNGSVECGVLTSQQTQRRQQSRSFSRDRPPSNGSVECSVLTSHQTQGRKDVHVSQTK